MEAGGRDFLEVGGREKRLGSKVKFFHTGLKKRWVSRILSSIIEERGKGHNKLNVWCKSFIRNLFKRSSHCLPHQYLIIISHALIRLVLLYTVKSDRI